MLINLIGQKFGMLTVIEHVAPTPPNKVHFWICQCDCGIVKKIAGRHLRGGQIKSCGCSKRRRREESPSWRGCGQLSLNHFGTIRRSAMGGGKFNRRVKEFSITIEQAWEQFVKQNGKCALTGLQLSFGEGTQQQEKHSSTSTKTASLDRIDSTKGYVVGNIQWVHKDVNIMKNDLDSKTFFYYCSLIHENRLVQDRSDPVHDASACAS